MEAVTASSSSFSSSSSASSSSHFDASHCDDFDCDSRRLTLIRAGESSGVDLFAFFDANATAKTQSDSDSMENPNSSPSIQHDDEEKEKQGGRAVIAEVVESKEEGITFLSPQKRKSLTSSRSSSSFSSSPSFISLPRSDDFISPRKRLSLTSSASSFSATLGSPTSRSLKTKSSTPTKRMSFGSKVSSSTGLGNNSKENKQMVGNTVAVEGVEIPKASTKRKSITPKSIPLSTASPSSTSTAPLTSLFTPSSASSSVFSVSKSMKRGSVNLVSTKPIHIDAPKGAFPLTALMRQRRAATMREPFKQIDRQTQNGSSEPGVSLLSSPNRRKNPRFNRNSKSEPEFDGVNQNADLSVSSDGSESKLGEDLSSSDSDSFGDVVFHTGNDENYQSPNKSAGKGDEQAAIVRSVLAIEEEVIMNRAEESFTYNYSYNYAPVSPPTLNSIVVSSTNSIISTVTSSSLPSTNLLTSSSPDSALAALKDSNEQLMTAMEWMKSEHEREMQQAQDELIAAHHLIAQLREQLKSVRE